VTCAFDLIKRGLRVRLVGKDVARDLKELVSEVLEHRRNAPIEEFNILLSGWIRDIHERFGEKEKYETFVAECDDKASCLAVIAENCNDAKCVLRRIDEFFVDSDEVAEQDERTVVLCSGHRSKGLEWDRVVILRPDLLPHPAAESPEDLEQEEHIKYVMFTRVYGFDREGELLICADRRP
jgi:superfamily I DNA/RNA helicase